MDISFKGYVPVSETASAPRAVCIGFNPDYTTKRGEAHGPVVFLETAKSAATETRMEFATANAAVAAVAEAVRAGQLPADTKVYANGGYRSIAEALKLKLIGFVFKNKDRAPGWRVQYMTQAHADAKNAQYTGGTPPKAPTPKVAAKGKKNSVRPLF